MNLPTINVVQNEKPPENRKDIVMMFLKSIRDASAAGNLDQELSATLNFIISAIPEIPEKEYMRNRPFKLEPTFDEVQKHYIKSNKPLVLAAHKNRIERWRKEIFLRRLQEERLKIEDLLKIHTNWYFDNVDKQTHGQ